MNRFYGQDESNTEQLQDFVVGSWDAVKFARTAASFMSPEAGLPVLQAQFNSHRNFNWVSGILANLQNSASDATCCTEWAREFGLPDPDILIDLTKAMETAYIQGVISDPSGATTDQMQYWYAQIIANREQDEANIIEAIKEGEIPITQTEADATQQANMWREMVNAGGAQRAVALNEASISPTTGAVLDTWESTVSVADSAATHAASPKVNLDTLLTLPTTADLRSNLSNLVKFGGFGAIEKPAITNGDQLPLPTISWMHVAGGGVALYLFLEALSKLRQGHQEK